MQKYTCKTCDAELYWDSSVGALKCEYCDSVFQPSDFMDESMQSQKGETADKYDVATDESDSLDLVMYKCTECGAEIITAKGTVATTCAYCNRAITLSNKMTGAFKPASLIPFNVNKKEAKEIFKRYAKNSFLTPKEFQDDKVLTKMKGLYVPFYLHTFTDNADAELNCENTTTRRRGDDKLIIHHKYKVRMKANGLFSKIPTDALEKMDNQLMDNIEPFDYGHLKEFNPAYMAGFYAEQYNETSSQLFPRAHERAVDAMKKEMIKSAGYESTSIVMFDDNISDYDSEYTMLPVWIFNAEYKNKKYTFAMNGDTGKITGKLPISIPKMLALIGTSFLGTQIIALIFRLLEVM